MWTIWQLVSRAHCIVRTCASCARVDAVMMATQRSPCCLVCFVAFDIAQCGMQSIHVHFMQCYCCALYTHTAALTLCIGVSFCLVCFAPKPNRRYTLDISRPVKDVYRSGSDFWCLVFAPSRSIHPTALGHGFLRAYCKRKWVRNIVRGYTLNLYHHSHVPAQCTGKCWVQR